MHTAVCVPAPLGHPVLSPLHSSHPPAPLTAAMLDAQHKDACAASSALRTSTSSFDLCASQVAVAAAFGWCSAVESGAIRTCRSCRLTATLCVRID